jgi:autoinducer 2-degrading protein
LSAASINITTDRATKSQKTEMKPNHENETAPGGARESKLAIIGTIEIASGRRNQLLPLLMAHRARCLKDEPGTLQFEVLAPLEDETKVLLYEVYHDAVAFDVHRNGQSIAQWREETAGMVVKIYFTKCALVDPSANV